MSALRVVRRVPVTTYEEVVVLETDDPCEAQAFVMDDHAAHPTWDTRNTAMWAHVAGPHPTHTWAAGRCTACGGWDNGSYGSQFPCGYDFAGRSLYAVVQEWRAHQAAVTR